MPQTLDRREFLNTAGLAATAGLLALSSQTAIAAEEKPRLRKALKLSMVGGKGSLVDKFKLAKAAGFEGIDVDSDQPVDEVKRAMSESGLIVHGMVDYVHWGQPLSSPDPAVRAQGVAVLQKCLRETKIYGGTTVHRLRSKNVFRWRPNWGSKSCLKTSGTIFCSARSRWRGILTSFKVRWWDPTLMSAIS